MLRLLPATVSILAVSAIGLWNSSAVSCYQCPNFEPADVTGEWIARSYKGAVLRVTTEGVAPGTAFLIDSERGYALTARHVVVGADDQPRPDLKATSPRLPGKALELVVLASLPVSDVALVQVVDPGALVRIAPFDLSFRLPRPNEAFYVMGYPDIVDNHGLSVQKGEALRTDSKRRLEVKQTTFPGDSGSPLVDSSGKVIAICLSRLLTPQVINGELQSVSWYRSTAELLELLSKIPAHPRVHEFDEQLRTGVLTGESLQVALEPSLSGLTNLDLLAWLFMVRSRPASDYSRAAGTFVCPIVPACMERRLDNTLVLQSLAGFMVSSVKAEEMLRLIDEQTARAQFEEALKTLSAFETELTKIPDPQTRVRLESAAAARKVHVELALGRPMAAFTASKGVKLPDNSRFVGVMATAAGSAGDLKTASTVLRQAELPPATSVGQAQGERISRQFRSGPKWSGAGREFSEEYRLCSPASEAPKDHVVESASFQLVGDRVCGSWATCREVSRTETSVCHAFSMQGHDEWSGAQRALSEGILTVFYRTKASKSNSF